jgi:hypothetical protein
MRQAITTKETTTIIVFAGRKLPVLDVLPKGVPPWIKSSTNIRETLCFTITAPTTFARYTPLRLLVLWNVEGSLEK